MNNQQLAAMGMNMGMGGRGMMMNPYQGGGVLPRRGGGVQQKLRNTRNAVMGGG